MKIFAYNNFIYLLCRKKEMEWKYYTVVCSYLDNGQVKTKTKTTELQTHAHSLFVEWKKVMTSTLFVAIYGEDDNGKRVALQVRYPTFFD